MKQDGEARIRYRECGETDAVRRVLQDDFRLGIIRYPAAHDRYYKSLLEDKRLDYELICEFRYLLIFSKNSPLAGKERIYTSDLRELTMITHADPAQPFSLPDQKKDESDGEPSRSIVVYERASQFSILEKDPTTYMWVSPVPRETLGKYGLETRECEDDRAPLQGRHDPRDRLPPRRAGQAFYLRALPGEAGGVRRKQEITSYAVYDMRLCQNRSLQSGIFVLYF